MPVQGWGHSQYWTHSDTLVTPVRKSIGGYPAWQASVTAGTLFGGLQAWWEWLVTFVRFYRRLSRLDDERRQTVLKVMDAVEAPVYALAQQAVRETAVTLGFNRPQAWVALSHTLKDHHPWAENAWRHINAMHLMTEAAQAHGSTVTNPERNLLTELAYHGFALRGQ